ncbi:MAG: hypothetical protein NC206_06530 [Bacteroides sp.]|nr:hypothetical protein [Roseburia sp.]MCM1346725.1 hypothetical protein [Bacteroides sp.]MCM1421295.1 hypothetical protein [Bacteroides sp.]
MNAVASGGIKRVLLFIASFLYFFCANAQEHELKDGAALYSFGLGYERMPDAYSSKGIALDVRVRFYTSGRLFIEMMGHWGSHEGDKEVIQNSRPFSIQDERHCLLGAFGPGYEIFQSENGLFDIYVKGLAGYGVRHAEYDDYQLSGNEDGTVILGCQKNKKGITFVAGTGADLRFRRWTLTFSVDALYVGNGWDIAPMVSFGFFL